MSDIESIMSTQKAMIAANAQKGTNPPQGGGGAAQGGGGGGAEGGLEAAVEILDPVLIQKLLKEEKERRRAADLKKQKEDEYKQKEYDLKKRKEREAAEKKAEAFKAKGREMPKSIFDDLDLIPTDIFKPKYGFPVEALVGDSSRKLFHGTRCHELCTTCYPKRSSVFSGLWTDGSRVEVYGLGVPGLSSCRPPISREN